MRSFLLALGVALGVAIAATLGVAYVVTPGGAPQYPSHGGWVDQAHTALGSVASDVATVQLLLRLAERDRVMGNYQQIVALNAETEAGKVSDHLTGEQTHPQDDATYTQVTTALSLFSAAQETTPAASSFFHFCLPVSRSNAATAPRAPLR